MGSSALSEKSEITPEDIAAWYTPFEACKYAATCMDTKAGPSAVWQLLLAGMIEAVASSSSMTPKGRGPITDTKPIIIPKQMWGSMSTSGSDLWNGAYVRFWVGNSDGGTAYQFFGIKLSPDDIHARLPPPRPPLKSGWVKKTPEPEKPTRAPEVEAPEPEQKGPAVSQDHLKAWFGLYQKVYSGSADTEANAVASARGMFPGKSVSRDRIRELRGNQKRGRKPTDAAK
jgi:hypothetical protein